VASLNSPALGLALLVVIATTVSLLLHARNSRYWGVSAVAGTVSGVLWTGLTLVISAPTSLVGVSWVFGTFWAFVISCLVGIPFRLRRSGAFQ
jgi:hypothetical protein